MPLSGICMKLHDMVRSIYSYYFNITEVKWFFLQRRLKRSDMARVYKVHLFTFHETQALPSFATQPQSSSTGTDSGEMARLS